MIDDWLDLLPIESLESLLERLASQWRRILDNELVVVSCLSSSGNRIVAGWSRGDSSGTLEAPLPYSDACWQLDSPRFLPCYQGLIPDPADMDWVVPVPEDKPFAGIQGMGGNIEDESSDWQRNTLEIPSERLLTQARLLDRLQRDALAEKLESMAEFAAGAGHEINNPLATINGRVQLLLKDETDPERRRSLTVIGGQAYRIRDMIGDAMLFARPPEPELSDVDAAGVAQKVVDTLGEDLEAGPSLTIEADDVVVVRADETQLAIVVSELIHNAIHAVGGTGNVVVRVAQDTASGGREPPVGVAGAAAPNADGRIGNPSHAVITFSDDGPGLTDLDRRHLFDPFYSGRQAGRGLGFGLSKAWRIVRLHGGRIDVDSSDGRTTFRVTWPLAAQ